MTVKLIATLSVALVVFTATAWAQGGGGGGGSGSGSGGTSAGGSAGSGPSATSTPTGADTTANGGNANSITRQNGTNDKKGVPSPSTIDSSGSQAYAPSSAGSAAVRSLGSTDTGVMKNPNAAPPSSDNGGASAAPAGRAGDKTPSRDAR